jgi:hypothetical protein
MAMAEKSRSDFAHFYTTDLLKELRRLEAVRKAVLRKVMILGGVAAGVVGAAAWLSLAQGAGVGPIAVTAFLAVGAGRLVYGFIIGDYVRQFKAGVIGRIVTYIDPSLQYWPKSAVDQGQFVTRCIFNRIPDRLRGDDHVKGRIGYTSIEFSELHAEYKTESYSGRGGRRRRWHTIFKGLFFIADFNKAFEGVTVVLPDTAEKLFGSAGAFFQSLNKSRGELVKLEDPEFERAFVVYGTDQIESRYILSTSLMKRILGFRKKTGRQIYLSFVGSQVFVAVSYRKGLFEPRVFSPITEFACAEQYYDDLELAVGIVDDLNLNIRIWSKGPDQSLPPQGA